MKSATRRQMPAELRPAGITTFSDLFCGIGGFHYAAESLGLRCAFACDIDEGAQAQYEHNFGMRPIGDIHEVKGDQIPAHDILFGGFPCQPFSIIGNRHGLRDGRGGLIFEIVRILRHRRPKAFVLENVRQFSTLGKGTVIRQVMDALEGIGYACQWRILNALDYGLPQKRERTIIVGFAAPGALAHFAWPKPMSKRKTLKDVLEANPHPRHSASKYIRERRRRAHTAPLSPSIWHENKAGNVSSHPFSCALRSGASYNYLLVNGERRLTPREQLRLQGFPDDFEVIGSDSQIRRQTGNAVPVPMVRAVIRSVLRAAAQHSRTQDRRLAASGALQVG